MQEPLRFASLLVHIELDGGAVDGGGGNAFSTAAYKPTKLPRQQLVVTCWESSV